MSASRMNSAVVIFLDDVAKVQTVVEKGINIRDTFIPVLPLVSPAKRITISNAPPFIKSEDLVKELSHYSQLISPVKMVLLGCKSQKLKHVVCHRRQVFMILKDNATDLNLTFSFKVEGFNYVVFATSDTMKCLVCDDECHLVRSCPAVEKWIGSVPRGPESASKPAGPSGFGGPGRGGASGWRELCCCVSCC